MSNISFDDLDQARARFKQEPTNEMAEEMLASPDIQRRVIALRANPLVQRLARYQIAATGKDPETIRFTQPWMADAERLFFTLLVLAPGMAVTLNGMPSDSFTKAAVWASLEVAAPYSWRSEIYTLASQLPVPRHTITREFMPNSIMYWSWEAGNHIRGFSADGEPYESSEDALLVQYSPPGLVISTAICCSEYDGRPSLSFSSFPPIRIGSTWPDDYSEEDRPGVSRTLALIAFLNSPYVDTRATKHPRDLRREMKRKNHASPLEVNVVSLRAIPRHPAPGGDGAGITHHSRWWVRGHIRAQWYPSLNGHKLIWIREHLKGPEGTPMITKVYDVKR